MQRLRDLFTPWSFFRYSAWRASKSQWALGVRLKSGERLSLRPPPATDLLTAYEVFVARIYDPVRREGFSPTRIVDVGANVGYTCVLWGTLFPEARVTAFEPHPVHIRALRENLRLNGLESRVEVVAAAAGVERGRAAFRDAENESGLVTAEQPLKADGPAAASRTIDVDVADLFEALGRDPVDLLKMDIEGGEYPLLADPRFAVLGPRAMALEWHRTTEHPDGKAWCLERLRSLGYAVSEGRFGTADNGMIFGSK